MIPIFFGTETGNAELVAEDICDVLNQCGYLAKLLDLEKFDVQELAQYPLGIFICSTYGDGELPATAIRFYEALHTSSIDLSGSSFAYFGLGDSYYQTFNNGIHILEQTFQKMGVMKIGELGMHDASDGGIPSDTAMDWLNNHIIPALEAQTTENVVT